MTWLLEPSLAGAIFTCYGYQWGPEDLKEYALRTKYVFVIWKLKSSSLSLMKVWSWKPLSIDRSKSHKDAEVLLTVVSLSQVNGINLSQVILTLWVVYEQIIIDVPICEIQIEPRCQLFPSGWEQRLHTSKEICRLKEGKNWFPLEYRLSAGKPFPQKQRKCCLLETRASWRCHLQRFWRLQYCAVDLTAIAVLGLGCKLNPTAW